FILWNSFHAAVPGKGSQFVLFQNWREFGQGKTWEAITNSFILALRHPVSLGLAFVIAWLIARVRIPLGGFIELSLWLVYLSPTMSLVISWILLLDPNFGLLNKHLLNHFGLTTSIYSLYGITWVHFTSSTLPVMVILIVPLLRRTEAVLEEAARVCGASPT